jgi:alkaline phosphatase D
MRRLVSCLLVLLLVAGCARSTQVATSATHSDTDAPGVIRVNLRQLPTRIAFGSCSEEDKPQPILNHVVAHHPDLFIYLGDNIYGDSRNLDTLRAKYGRLAAKPEHRRLRESTTLLATWDDHDYGWNDTGRHFELKNESKQLFLDFWGEPRGSERWTRPGIYTSYMFEANGKRLQVIMLDTRWFRDNLLRNDRVPPHKNDYRPNPSPDSTILGAAQWAWLETQLRMRADVRIIASSIQYSHEYNGWESWTNVPHERERMRQLIRTTRANGVVFISGDVHWGEVSRWDTPDMYPLWDVTSSGLTETWPSVEPNTNRVGPVVRENNFGEIEIDWSRATPALSLRLFDVTGALRTESVVDAGSLVVR